MSSSGLWQSVVEFRQMPRAEINLMCSATAGNDPYFARIVREFYVQARRRHRKFPLIRQMTHGVALCRVPPTFDEYFKMIKAAARRNYRKAVREGCTVRPIEINNHLPEIGQIRASMKVRQGKLMPAHYRTGAPAQRFDVHRSSNRTHDYVYFGAFLGKELIGYAYCLIAGEGCCITHILGHAKHLSPGVVPQLIISMAKYLYENHPLVQYYAYGSYFGCRDTMKRFKRKFGFGPHRVTWQLGDQNEGQNMQVVVSPLNRLKRLAKRVWRGPTAMERVLQELSNRGVCVSKLRTVELFAGEGTIQTVDYASEVGELDLWEMWPH